MAGSVSFREGGVVRPDPATRGSVPVIANFAASLSPADAARLEGLAARLKANEPTLSSTDPFGPGVEAGMGDGPALVIGDHREVSLMTPRDAAI
ncbi:MAG TPA: hypothetical protein VK844_04535, partial [Hyphomicrobiales bacterium]|nr:hypothetical protein [Hyphomicrobiales bacterium]